MAILNHRNQSMLFCAEPHGQCTEGIICTLWLFRTLGVTRALKHFEANRKNKIIFTDIE